MMASGGQPGLRKRPASAEAPRGTSSPVTSSNDEQVRGHAGKAPVRTGSEERPWHNEDKLLQTDPSLGVPVLASPGVLLLAEAGVASEEWPRRRCKPGVLPLAEKLVHAESAAL